MYAEIIIPLALPKNYTWSIPPHLIDSIQTGCRVEVNLGKNKKYAGIVKHILADKPQGFETKDILNVLDATGGATISAGIMEVDCALLYVYRRRGNGGRISCTF